MGDYCCIIAANVGVYLLNHPAETPSKKPSKPTTAIAFACQY